MSLRAMTIFRLRGRVRGSPYAPNTRALLADDCRIPGNVRGIQRRHNHGFNAAIRTKASQSTHLQPLNSRAAAVVGTKHVNGRGCCCAGRQCCRMKSGNGGLNSWFGRSSEPALA